MSNKRAEIISTVMSVAVRLSMCFAFAAVVYLFAVLLESQL
jgi:hypothetical protein